MTARTEIALDEIACAVVRAFPKLSATEQQISLALYRLLSQGEPVDPGQISEAAGIPLESVRNALDRWYGIKRNSDGAIVGHWGLSVSRTKHRLRINGRELYAWCAWDTLFLPRLLDATADVESVCPVTGQSISLRISPTGIESVSPGSAVLSFLIPRKPEIEAGVVENFCCCVHFFRSIADAEQWIGAHARTFLLSLDDAWQIGLRKNAAQYPRLAARPSLFAG